MGVRFIPDPKIPPMIAETADGLKFFRTSNDDILPHDEAILLIESLRQFYATVTEADIIETNAYYRKLWGRKPVEPVEFSVNRGSVYLIQAGESSHYKIGQSGDVSARMRGLQSSNPIQLRLVYSRQTNYAWQYEEFLHSYFAGKRVRGEWFHLQPEDVDWITHSGPQAFQAWHANTLEGIKICDIEKMRTMLKGRKNA